MPDVGYFVTITTVGWIDVFTRLKQKYAIIDSLQYCQNYKGLEIYAYCIMSSRFVRQKNDLYFQTLSEILKNIHQKKSSKQL